MRRSVANRLTEADQPQGEDVEMATIAEDELLNEKFSVQGLSMGKNNGRKKVVSRAYSFVVLSNWITEQFALSFFRHWRTLSF